MILTILGCGTSSGVPLIGCPCRVCKSSDPRNQRTRASVWIQTGKGGRGKSILIDSSADFRAQALRENIPRIDAVLYTHPHADHISGIDDLRSYNFIQKSRIPLYGNAWTERELAERFQYIFKPTRVEGGGIPTLDFHLIDSGAELLDIVGVPVIPLSVQHGSKECVGYRIGSVAYVTDCHYIPDQTLARMQGLDYLILDCVRIDPHPTHLNMDSALEVVRKLKPRATAFTHLGHEFEFAEWNQKLPDGVTLAYDGMQIELN